MDHAKNYKEERKNRLSKKGMWYREQNHIRKERALSKDKYIRRDKDEMTRYIVSVSIEDQNEEMVQREWNALIDEDRANGIYR